MVLRITDLGAAAASRQETSADVCIVGAGAAGTYLASELAKRGVGVLIVEAGPRQCVDAEDMGFAVEFGATHYSGATAGRFFGLGGSTSRWGGLLAPHTDLDLRQGQPSHWAWRRILGAVEEASGNVLANLGFGAKADFEISGAKLCGAAKEGLATSGIRVLAPLHMPFRRKNLASLLETSQQSKCPLRVVVGAVAKSWRTEISASGARVRTLIAASRGGGELSVSASMFVIAAGAIESTRILLEIDSAGGVQLLPAESSAGCYLGDHLSLPIANIVASDQDLAAAMFGPRFTGAWLRSFRFLDAKPDPASLRSFAHVSFDNASAGFNLARKFLQAVQQRKAPDLSAGEVFAGAGDVMQIGYARMLQSRLHIPRGTPAQMQLDVEQSPATGNRIRLGKRLDAYGRRAPIIDWRITDSDMENIACKARRFLAIWPGRTSGLPDLSPLSLDPVGIKPHDAYHPTGTCRMGDAAGDVVDGDLKVRGTDNLFVASTAVLPSAGTANPTFTLLCLTHRLAGHLAAKRMGADAFAASKATA